MHEKTWTRLTQSTRMKLDDWHIWKKKMKIGYSLLSMIRLISLKTY